MSDKLVKFPSPIRFKMEILKYVDCNENQQEIVICLYQQDTKRLIVSPVTSLLKCWEANSSKTKYEYGSKIVCLLNYLYFERKVIKSFSEITTDMIADYLNSLTQNKKSRSYVLRNKKVFTKLFYYVTYRYRNLCQIDNSEFKVNTSKKDSFIVWPELDTKVLLPPAKTDRQRKINKITNLEIDLVFRFLEIAMYECPNCVLGFYFLFFAGLRGSEACHLLRSDIPPAINSESYFYINIEDKVLNTDSKYADLNLCKKSRKQMVLVISDLLHMLLDKWDKTYKEGPIIRNRYGGSMTIIGLEYNFNKVKQILIEKLNDGDVLSKEQAFRYRNYSWSTHVGRGFFTNLCSENTDNAYDISVMRGDSNFSSALPYISESTQTINKITTILENMYRKCKEEDK